MSFQTWPPRIQLNLPGMAEAESPLPMLHFHGEQKGRHEVKFTRWKQLRGAGDWSGTAEPTGKPKQGGEPGWLPAAPRGLLRLQALAASLEDGPALEC